MAGVMRYSTKKNTLKNKEQFYIVKVRQNIHEYEFGNSEIVLDGDITFYNIKAKNSKQAGQIVKHRMSKYLDIKWVVEGCIKQLEKM